MPAVPLPPFRPDRFGPAVHRVETPSYNQRTSELRDDWLRRLEQSTFLTIKYGLIDAEGALDRSASWATPVTRRTKLRVWSHTWSVSRELRSWRLKLSATNGNSGSPGSSIEGPRACGKGHS